MRSKAHDLFQNPPAAVLERCGSLLLQLVLQVGHTLLTGAPQILAQLLLSIQGGDKIKNAHLLLC